MEDKIVTLGAYYDVMEAEIIRARLEAHDIPCFIADDNVMNSVPAYNLMMGGVRIQVFEHDLEIYRAILADEPILAEGDA